MDGVITINLIMVAIFIGLTAFFVGAEFAILKVRMSRIDQLISEGNKKAVTAKKVAHDLDYYLSACQLGITITALVLGALGEPTVERILHPLFDQMGVPAALSTLLSYLIALSIITFLHVVIGELAPKTLAIQYAERMTLLLAPPLFWFGKITYPFITALNGSARLLLRIFGVKPAGHETVHSEEELKWIVDQSYESGEINKTELVYLNNIFAFDERTLGEIIVPVSNVITLQAGMSVEQLIQVLGEHDYTRYPVVAADGTGRFTGYVNTKEMLTSVAAGRATNWQSYIHDIPKFPASKNLRDVLLRMQTTRVHMAAVTDTSGAITGIVTMEDLLEEIVGDIRDESLNVNVTLN
ncbi:hemolysin family protein [Paenibacillus sp. FSL R7-0331]|uniref:hemolysin family protein n=1 Tax=Paenibacillus sp. FSL R7-0331 TaxID=1536773 RepID=UPI0004F775D2|nr:hemolysin family protein [Paenibacillus sp. FSL R7-0331]AIQ52819.1 transporter associated domain protein [Paenibacillus sp. FSL R7-0331]